jgi:uncharacterized protein (DUF2141 family)
MNKYFAGVVLLILPLCVAQTGGQRQLLQNSVKGNQQMYSLIVSVNKLRNAKGQVQFSLYNKKRTIPDQYYKKYFRQLKGKIINGRSTVRFQHLPKGRYAVNILHDENNNGKIDKGFILPVEGIGFSNFQSIGLRNRPNFKRACFELKGNMNKSVKIIYF